MGFLKIIGLVGLGVSLSITLTGVMFVVQHWTGGLFYLITGMLFLLIIGTMTLIKRSLGNSNEIYNNILIRVGVGLIGGLSILAAVIN